METIHNKYTGSLDNTNLVLWQNYFIFKHEIGSGSYSKVYKAIDNVTKEFVAIKKISKSRLSNTLIERFIKEIEILKNINHPNIIQFKNSLVTDKYIFIITEFCDGGSVKDLIEKGLDEGEVRNVIYQLVKGLHYLDSINILHRDIKPDNLLLTKSNVLKIIDFGFSYQNKMSDELYNTICGTPMYMSPELLSGKPYSKKSDLWSVGIIAYELFHSKNPFGKPRNIQELIYCIKNYKVLYRADISPHFLDFLNHLIISNPNERLDYENITRHPWFTQPIHQSTIDDDIFSMDDITESTLEYLSSSQIKSKDSSSSLSSMDESPSSNKIIKTIESSYTEINLPDGDKVVKNIKSSIPIDIVNKKKVNIIENFFEKPCTFDPEYLNISNNSSNNSFTSMEKKPASDGMLTFPIKVIKSIIKTAYNSPVLETINTFSPF